MANKKQRKADEGLVARYLNPMTDYGFKRLFGEMGTLAELAKLSKSEITRYFTSLDSYRTQRAVLSFEREKGEAAGFEKGRAEGEAIGIKKGRAEGMADVAKSMLSMGMPVNVISQCTGLTEEEIESLMG